jgi:stage V sporulation protein B
VSAKRLADPSGSRTPLSEPAEGHERTSRTGIPWIFAGSVTFFVIGGVFYLYLAHVLPTNELGSVVVLGAIAILVGTGAALGLGTGFQHFLSFHQGRSEFADVRALVRASFATSSLLGLAAASIVAGSAGPLSVFFFHSQQYTQTIELLGLYSGLYTASSILQSVLIGLQRFVAFSVAYMIGSTATYGIPVVLLQFWPSVESIVLGWVVGSAIALTLAAGLVLRYGRPRAVALAPERPTQSGKTLYRNVLLYSFPVLASALISTGAAYVDRLVLASLANLSTVGIYNYAILVTTGSLFLVGPFQTVLVPRISELFGRDDPNGIRRVHRTGVTLIVLVYVPFALGLAAIGPFLLRLLVGAAFVPASLPMALLLGITALSIPYTILLSLASGIRRTQILLHASSVSLVSNIALSVLLVPRFGMLGAAVGNSSMYWVAFLVMYLELRGTDLVRFDVGSISRIWAASLVMCTAVAGPLILLAYRPLLVPLFIAVGIAVFLLSLRLVRAVQEDTVEAMVHMLPRWAAGVRPLICWVGACDHCHHAEELSGPVSPRSVLPK